MDKEEYIESLENLLIFLCSTYVEQEKVLKQLAKEGNRAILSVPRIQGSENTVPVSQLAEMEFKVPKLGFKEIENEISEKRNENNKGEPSGNKN